VRFDVPSGPALGGLKRGELEAIADKSNIAIAATAYVDADGRLMSRISE
jgi:hypothetical protein